MQSACDMLLFVITDLQVIWACTLLFCFLCFMNVAHLKIDWLKFKDAPKPHRNGLMLLCFTSDNLDVTSTELNLLIIISKFVEKESNSCFGLQKIYLK